nr:TonB-dependent receptor [Bacteroides acidifaciens]
MKTDSLKTNRKMLAAILLCAGFVTGQPLAVQAESNNQQSVHATQQQIKITGTVNDSMGPVIGASVTEKGNTSNGTITDLNGNFSLTVKPGATLVISYVGYKTQEVRVIAGKAINITLKEDSEMLDEVVVVGFGTQKKVNLTGAVDVVDNKQLLERPVSNAAQALQGIVPGLQITQSSGSLESRPSINIRGTGTIGEGSSGDPLILIDGMEGDLNTINPQDIESISVLKDAAASSIYGSRAPFGVVLVTTKSGSKSGKASINYNNSFRFGTPINMKHMMNSLQFASWMNDAFTNGGQSVYFNEERLQRILDWRNASPYGAGQRITEDGTILDPILASDNGQWRGSFSTGVADVDWFDEIYKDWTFSQEHNISANGGTEKFNYYVSGSFYDQNGFLKVGEEDLKRYTVTAKINSQLTKWLQLNYSMRFSREDYNRPASLTDGTYDAMAQNCWPVLPLYDRNGYYVNQSVAQSLAEGGNDIKQSDRIYHQFGIAVEPIKNWITHVKLNYRIKSDNRHWDSQYLYNHDIDGNAYRVSNSSNVHEDYYKENYFNFQAYSEYSLSLAEKHNFHIMGGFQAEEVSVTEFGLQRNGIILPSKPEVDLTTGLDVNGKPITPSTNGARSGWATVGIFGRFNYDYQGKYLLEVNLRGDGSSRFLKGNKWKVFPSVSLGWNIAEENFFEPAKKVVNLLKLRASYGSLGNQNMKKENWYQVYQTVNVGSSSGSWLQNGVKPNVAYAPGLVSQSLTWETVESYNIGLDWGLLNNRLTGSFNWYCRNTSNMIGNAPDLPSILGADVPKTNNTDLRTQGWELSLGWRDRLRNGLSYGAKFSLYDSRSKIMRYPNNPTGNIYGHNEGRYMNEIWGYETIGIARTDEEMRAHLATLPNGGQSAINAGEWKAGDIMYKDLNNDGKISKGAETLADHGDKKVIGNSTPRFQFGLDLNAAWKGFDVRVFFQGVMKRDYWQGSNYLFGQTNNGQWAAFGITSVGDYFRDESTWSVKEGYSSANLNSYLPRPLYSDKNQKEQTRYLQNAAYIRLKNLSIGYTLPAALTSKWSIEKVRIYFSGENLWTGTGLVEQFDPETIGSNKGNAYPMSKTLSCGISLTF